MGDSLLLLRNRGGGSAESGDITQQQQQQQQQQPGMQLYIRQPANTTLVLEQEYHWEGSGASGTAVPQFSLWQLQGCMIEPWGLLTMTRVIYMRQGNIPCFLAQANLRRSEWGPFSTPHRSH